eukprot:m.774636 g.774636  ORF g.774636 m.774636 type:complete len:171 (-) comp59107_c0_seq12:1731-2243(-)
MAATTPAEPRHQQHHDILRLLLDPLSEADRPSPAAPPHESELVESVCQLALGTQSKFRLLAESGQEPLMLLQHVMNFRQIGLDGQLLGRPSNLIFQMNESPALKKQFDGCKLIIMKFFLKISGRCNHERRMSLLILHVDMLRRGFEQNLQERDQEQPRCLMYDGVSVAIS